jgi:glycosyltransferase involved in cell wall biosynthesis
MRVCMFVTTDATSDPRVMKEAVALTQAGHTVQVLAVHRRGTEPVEEVSAGVQIRRLDLWHMRFVRWLKARRGLDSTQGFFVRSVSSTKQKRVNWFSRLAAPLHQVQLVLHILTVLIQFCIKALRHPADVYHAHDVDTLLPALLIGKLRTKSVIYDAHEYWYDVQRDQVIGNALIRLIERFGTPRCARVITVNCSIAKRMAMHYRIPVPTVLMNVPMDVPLHPPGSLRDDQPIALLFHGIYSAHRGLEALIAAMVLVKTSVHLTMRGYGEIELSLRALVDSLGLQTKVTFASPVSTDKIVQSALGHHVGILPFERNSIFYFSLPNKLFEYMAAGLAILANELPEIVAIVGKHDLGMVYDSEDPAVLAQAIDELASDRVRLRQYRQRAWQAYHECYTWERHQHVLLDIYAGLEQGDN